MGSYPVHDPDLTYWIDDDRLIVWRVDRTDHTTMRWTADEGWHPDPSRAAWLLRLRAIGSPDYINGPIPEAEALQLTGPLPE